MIDKTANHSISWFPSGKPGRFFLKFLLFGFWVAGILLNPAVSYPGRDPGIFLYIGSLILKGKIPYLDVWENKGPLLFYINALGLWLANGSRWGIWLLEFLFLVFSAFLLYSMIRTVLESRPAALAGVFGFLYAVGRFLQGGNYSEEYALLFGLLSWWLLVKYLSGNPVRYQDFLLGALLVMGVLLRPNNISLQLSAIGVLILIDFQKHQFGLLLKRVLLWASGAALVCCITAVYFYSVGALGHLIDVMFLFNFQYSETASIADRLSGAAAGMRALGLPFGILAAAGGALTLLSAAVALRSKQDARFYFLLAVWAGFLLEVFLSMLSGRGYFHYLIGWGPYLGVFVAYSIYGMKNITRANFDVLKPLALGLMLTSFLMNRTAWNSYLRTLHDLRAGREQLLEYKDPVSEYVLQNTLETDTVFIWGFRPIINFVSAREAGVYFLPYPLVHQDSPLTRRWADLTLAQVSEHPPTLIINLIEPADWERIPDLDPVVRKERPIKWKTTVLAHNYKVMLLFIEQNYIRVVDAAEYDIYRLIRE